MKENIAIISLFLLAIFGTSLFAIGEASLEKESTPIIVDPGKSGPIIIEVETIPDKPQRKPIPTEIKDSVQGGIGSLLGRLSDRPEVEFVLEGSSLLIKDDFEKLGFQGYLYGFGSYKFELGTGIGPSGNVIPLPLNIGIPVAGTSGHVLPHLGIELFNAFYSANTNHIRKDYIEYEPMLSLGEMLNFPNFQGLLLVRGGGSIGTLGYSTYRPALGGGLYVYINRARFAIEGTRIFDELAPIDYWKADVSIRITDNYWIGIFGEIFSIREQGNPRNLFAWINNQEVLSEYRIFVSIRKITSR